MRYAQWFFHLHILYRVAVMVLYTHTWKDIRFPVGDMEYLIFKLNV